MHSRALQAAFTLLEVMIALGVIAIVAAIAVPQYRDYVYRAQVAQAVADIAGMSMIISAHMTDNQYMPPDSLAAVKLDGRLDPWGRPYRYTDLVAAKGKGSSRKDKKLNPINSDFDLYSVGIDGRSKLPLTTKDSQDDVLRARDGKFIGLASEFDP